MMRQDCNQIRKNNSNWYHRKLTNYQLLFSRRTVIIIKQMHKLRIYLECSIMTVCLLYPINLLQIFGIKIINEMLLHRWKTKGEIIKWGIQEDHNLTLLLSPAYKEVKLKTCTGNRIIHYVWLVCPTWAEHNLIMLKMRDLVC